MAIDYYLTVHGLGQPHPSVPADERPYWLSVDLFHDIVRLVNTAGGRVALTFDDGNMSDASIAAPALCAANVPAAFFVVTGRIGRAGYLDADDIRALHKAGMAIGSHGAEHVRWTELANDVLRLTLERSLQRLSDIIGTPVTTVSIPFGSYDSRVVAVLRQLGVDRAYTSDRGPVVRGSWLVPRQSVRVDTPLSSLRELATRPVSRTDRLRARLRILRHRSGGFRWAT